ncbi:sugar transferase [Natrinema longum]|uniref:Sugar transferase n=1 Tax=Natrinema longum TaxID=370324 RepID=A0A8A2UAI6_9EURY|nr:sugar transferase [Natrinema longum]MBZ6496470.1 sugar transferase [Natrinema longum]QSW85624.1 sugar transferase [Natrinema longum]
MLTGWRYRIVSLIGVILATGIAVTAANHPVSQYLFTTYIPLFNRLDVTVLTGESLYWALPLSVGIVAGCLLPLYKPRPRRILETVVIAQKRVGVAGLALATLGFFQWSHRLPRATLVMIVGILMLLIPAWFVWIRRRPTASDGRTLIVGDDLAQIERIAPEVDALVLGYLCPTAVNWHTVTDGGVTVQKDDGLTEIENEVDTLTDSDSLTRLGGLSRIEDTLIEYDIDTVVLAFHHPDRAEFFGALDACYEHGVNAKVHREYANKVLVSEDAVGTLIDVEVEPWDPFDYLMKRTFDIVVSGTALLVLSPLILLIVLAIRLEGEGPVFFSQQRTYLYGETFQIKKFRTLKPKRGGEVGTVIETDRRTPLGTFLRTTHLDEIPQLWSILTGSMSIVGPRPAQTELESEFESEAIEWRQRWFVKPGLTGLAQINDATSQEPTEKVQYDLQYIRNQSLLLDLKILLRQLWKVVEDVAELAGRE